MSEIPVFDPNKGYTRVHSIEPLDHDKIQFGAKFDGLNSFKGWMDGYDPALHKERKPRKQTRRNTRVRSAAPEDKVESARKKTAAKRSPAKAKETDAKLKAVLDDAESDDPVI